MSGRNVHGLHANRLKISANQLEKKFAESWFDFHQDCDLLARIMMKDGDFTHGPPTVRDRVVAATIIQWLGSLVGESFVRNCLND